MIMLHIFVNCCCTETLYTNREMKLTNTLNVTPLLLCVLDAATAPNDPMIATDRLIHTTYQQFARDGLLTEEQVSKYTWPVYMRSIDEILQPIKAQSNGIQFRVLNPDIDNIIVYTEHPVYTAYRSVHHDPKIFAKGMIGFYRSVSYNVTLAACDGNKEQADRIFVEWEQVMAKDPAAWSWYMNFAFLLLQKV
jgi:hypothetical protein